MAKCLQLFQFSLLLVAVGKESLLKTLKLDLQVTKQELENRYIKMNTCTIRYSNLQLQNGEKKNFQVEKKDPRKDKMASRCTNCVTR